MRYVPDDIEYKRTPWLHHAEIKVRRTVLSALKLLVFPAWVACTLAERGFGRRGEDLAATWVVHSTLTLIGYGCILDRTGTLAHLTNSAGFAICYIVMAVACLVAIGSIYSDG